MNYEESLAFIGSVYWKGSVPGLERISELCRLLGSPEKKVRFVHVAGTNGKGSVSAIISSVLTASGYKTGLYTSPHLIDYTERFKIDGEDIGKDDFCRVAEIVKAQAEKMSDAPTEFEILTAMAFVYFAARGCDVAVLECGMGGRLDATNVIGTPVLSVITNVALDHTATLGDTELLIAREKAGIIKDAPVVLGKTSADVEKYIKDVCRNHGVRCAGYKSAKIGCDKVTENGVSFKYAGHPMTLPLCGDYQRINLRTALASIEELKRTGFEISDDAVEKGISSVKWIGRFERLSDKPLIYFDGAHNPDGARYAVKTFEKLFPARRAVVVTGVMADKDYRSVASVISRIASVVYCVKPDNPRALDPASLADVYRSFGVEAHAAESVDEGVRLALEAAGNCVVLCTGSLYMYGEIKRAVEDLKN